MSVAANGAIKTNCVLSLDARRYRQANGASVNQFQGLLVEKLALEFQGDFFAYVIKFSTLTQIQTSI